MQKGWDITFFWSIFSEKKKGTGIEIPGLEINNPTCWTIVSLCLTNHLTYAEKPPRGICWLCRNMILQGYVQDVCSMTCQILEVQTDIVPRLHWQLEIRDSTAPKMTLQQKVIKIKNYDVQKMSVYRELKFPVCGELFVFREDGMLLPAKLCKHFLPSQNVFPRTGISCLLKLLASVQKSILLENSHMQKWTCGTWSCKPHQSKGSIKPVHLWRWELCGRSKASEERPDREGMKFNFIITFVVFCFHF